MVADRQIAYCPHHEHNAFYQQLLRPSSPYSEQDVCFLEHQITTILSALQYSGEKYEILFDDLYWLYDDTLYSSLSNKHTIKRIVQLDLDRMRNLDLYPFFVEETVYYFNPWKNSI